VARHRVRSRALTGAGAAAAVLAALGGGSPDARAETVRYRAAPGPIANPERGVFRQQDDLPGPLLPGRGRDVRIVRGVFRLDAHRQTDTLPRPYLRRIARTFADARRQGVKLAVRFAYNFSASRADAPLPRVLGHIAQLGPVLRANADTIQVIEVGFVGAWGEGHSSTHGLDAPAAKRAIVEAELAHFPPAVKLAIRLPRDKRAMFGTTPLDAPQAHGTSAPARLGYTNDCFLAGHNDAGTWTTWVGGEAAAELAFVAQETHFVPMGGETCGLGAAWRRWANCASARRALAAQHWTMINGGYHRGVLALWRAGGCWGEIVRRLGHRFALVDADVPDRLVPGAPLDLRVRVRNDGYAAPYNPRRVDVVLRHRVSRARTILPTGADPRFWRPGEIHTVTPAASVPADLAPGRYDVLLHLADPSPRLRDRPRYAIRLANAGVWEPATGHNVLRAGVRAGR